MKGDVKNYAMGTVGVVILVLFTLYNYVPEDTSKSFGLENFWYSTVTEDEDPKAVYNKITNFVDDGSSSCNPAIRLSSSVKYTATNAVWVVEGESPKTSAELSKMRTDDIYYPWLTSKSKNILAPADMTFTNSNVEQEAESYTTISGKVGLYYYIEYKNVKCWWCCMDHPDTVKHTVKVGDGGEHPSVIAGTIIGLATPETEVSMYKILPGTTFKINVPLEDYFINGVKD